MMGILLTITKDKVKLVSYLTTRHAIEDVFDFKNCMSLKSLIGTIILLISSIKTEI